MKRNNLPSVCVFLLMMMGTVIFNSACNNKDDNLVVGDRVPPPQKRKIPPPSTITIVGNYLMEANSIAGVVHKDRSLGLTYIEDEEKSRFYIRTTSKDAEEALLKIAIEGLKVKFSGKVYEMNKEFAKDNKLPNDVKLYSLVSPDYSITILDEQ
mgnify:CR=1 FL=1